MRLGKDLRIVRPADFDTVFRDGSRVSDGRLLLVVRPNGLDRSRLGISVGRKYGNAVCRNRFKRLVREAFRQSAEAFPVPMDLVVIPRRGTQVDSLQEVLASLRALTEKVTRRFSREVDRGLSR